jgi:hypothetical protein
VERTETNDGERIRFSLPAPKFPGRSRFSWPLLMLLVGGGSGAGGSFAYHRASPDHQLSPMVMEKIDSAMVRVTKLEETTHTLELDGRTTSTKLDDIKESLGEIKETLNDLRRRGR